MNEMRAQRFAFLHAVFEAVEGGEGRMVRVHDIAESLDFGQETTDRTVAYLVGEGLLEWAAMGMIELTHMGLKEVEEALTNPDQPTEHFPASVVNYINVESMIGSQIQQGTSGSVQTLEAGQLDAIREVLADIRDVLGSIELEEDAEHVLECDLATVEAQLGSPRPKHGIVREALSSTRSILEGAAGGAAAPQLPALIHALKHLIASLPT